MAIPPINSTNPHLPLEAAQPVEEVALQIIQLVEHVAEKPTLSLEEAKELFRRLQMRTPLYYSSLATLQVEIFKVLHGLRRIRLSAIAIDSQGNSSRISLSQMLEEAILTAFLLFRKWRMYSFRKEKKNLWDNAQTDCLVLMKHVKTAIEMLEQSSAKNRTKKAVEQLKGLIATAYHLSRNREFLENSLKRPEDLVTALFTSEAVQFYEDSLSMCAFGIDQLHRHIEQKMRPSFAEALQNLERQKEKRPEFETLLQLVKSYQKTLTDHVDSFQTVLPRFIAERQGDREWGKFVKKLKILDPDYLNCAVPCCHHFRQLLSKWKEQLPLASAVGDASQNVSKRLDLHQKVIRTECERLGYSLESLFGMRDQTIDKINSYGLDTYLIPLNLIVEEESTVRTFETAIKNANVAQDIASRSFPQLEFPAFSMKDLLIRWSESSKDLICAIGAVDLTDQNPILLDAVRKGLSIRLDAFIEEVPAGNLRQFLRFLRNLIPPEDLPESHRNIAFSCFYSFLYRPVGNKLTGRLTEEELQWIKSLMPSYLSELDAIVKQRLFPKANEILRKLQLREESLVQKAYWTISESVLKGLEEEIHFFRNACHQMKDRVSRSPLQALIKELEQWQQMQKRMLTPELDTLFNFMVQHARESELHTLLTTIFCHLIFANSLARPIHRLLDLSDLFSEKPRVEEVVEKEIPKKIVVVEEEEADEPEPLPTPLDPLIQLQKRAPILVANEDPLIRFKRQQKMQHSIQNQFYLLALLEEERGAPYLKSLFRGGLDPLRLLEMTEKLALAFLPIQGGLESQHNGIEMAERLAKEEPLFGQEEMRPALEAQEPTLKICYWFSDDDGEEVEGIVSRCQEIWAELAKRPVAKEVVFHPLREMKGFLHRTRRHQQQNAFLLPQELPSLEVLLTTFEQALIGKKLAQDERFKRMITMAKRLDQYREKGRDCPILFTNRHAEVQIGILTAVMKGCLSNETLYAPSERRPLIHSHNVLDLWEALEGDKEMRAKLTLFVGDPRYPYPNKTAISDDLVRSFELSKLKTGFWSKELLKKYEKNSSISEHFDHMEKKSRFALQIALELITRIK